MKKYRKGNTLNAKIRDVGSIPTGDYLFYGVNVAYSENKDGKSTIISFQFHNYEKKTHRVKSHSPTFLFNCIDVNIKLQKKN